MLLGQSSKFYFIFSFHLEIQHGLLGPIMFSNVLKFYQGILFFFSETRNLIELKLHWYSLNGLLTFCVNQKQTKFSCGLNTFLYWSYVPSFAQITNILGLDSISKFPFKTWEVNHLKFIKLFVTTIQWTSQNLSCLTQTWTKFKWAFDSQSDKQN